MVLRDDARRASTAPTLPSERRPHHRSSRFGPHNKHPPAHKGVEIALKANHTLQEVSKSASAGGNMIASTRTGVAEVRPSDQPRQNTLSCYRIAINTGAPSPTRNRWKYSIHIVLSWRLDVGEWKKRDRP